MSNLSYIATNLDELFERSPSDIQAMITGEELNAATAILGKIYKLPVSSYVALENIISYILIGALKPEDTVRAIMDMLGLSEEDAYKLASDMEKSILEKARIKILGKPSNEMVTLTFGEGRTPQDLRKEILDTTKQESVFAKKDEAEEVVMSMPSPTAPKKNVFAPAGSRTQLMEQLQILDTIPKDEEVEARLNKIREQITGTTPKENTMESPVALAEFMPNGDKSAVEAETKPATYSKAPTKYNVDPYREVLE
jgi:hypothetical protein